MSFQNDWDGFFSDQIAPGTVIDLGSGARVTKMEDGSAVYQDASGAWVPYTESSNPAEIASQAPQLANNWGQNYSSGAPINTGFTDQNSFNSWLSNLQRTGRTGANYEVPDWMRMTGLALNNPENRDAAYAFFKNNPQYAADYERIMQGGQSAFSTDGTSLIKTNLDALPKEQADYFRQNPSELLAYEGFGFDPILARQVYQNPNNLPEAYKGRPEAYLRENKWTPNGVVKNDNLVMYAQSGTAGNYWRNPYDLQGRIQETPVQSGWITALKNGTLSSGSGSGSGSGMAGGAPKPGTAGPGQAGGTGGGGSGGGLYGGSNPFGGDLSLNQQALLKALMDQTERDAITGEMRDNASELYDRAQGYEQDALKDIALFTGGNSGIYNRYQPDIENDVATAVADARTGQTQALNTAARQAARYGISMPVSLAGVSTAQAAQLASAANSTRNNAINNYRNLVGQGIGLKEGTFRTSQAATADAMGRAESASMGNRNMRIQDESLDWAKQLDVTGMARGMPGASQGAYGVAVGAGNSAVQNQMAPGQALIGAMGQSNNTTMQGRQIATQGLSSVLNAQTSANNAALSQDNGLFGAIGTLGGAAITAF